MNSKRLAVAAAILGLILAIVVTKLRPRGAAPVAGQSAAPEVTAKMALPEPARPSAATIFGAPVPAAARPIVANADSAIRQFAAWSERYLAAPPTDRAGL